MLGGRSGTRWQPPAPTSVLVWRGLPVDRARWTKFFHAFLELGVIVPPSPFEAWFVSSAHDEATIAEVVERAHRAFAAAR